MDKQEKLELLQQWKDAYDRCGLATQPLRELIGDLPHDSLIYKAMWDTFDQLTKTTAMVIGDYEAGEYGLFMRWYELDCGMGEHPQKIDGVLIDSLETFVSFL